MTNKGWWVIVLGLFPQAGKLQMKPRNPKFP